jgi:CHRD domain
MGTRHGLMLAMAGLLVAIGACGDDDDDGTNPATDFATDLSGTEEEPPVTTSATGNATISIEGDQIVYHVETTGLVDILFSHIHIGAPGENGPVRLNLCGTPNTPACAAEDGVLIDGSSGVTEPPGDISFDSLVSAIRAGNAYVNVHTGAHVTGEIRGQLEPQ